MKHLLRVIPLVVFMVLLVFSAVPAKAQPTPPTAAPAVAPAPLRFAAVVAEARALVHQDLAEKGHPGIALAVSVDGQTIWSEGFGYANLEHRMPMWPTVKFRIGSISKPLTAAAGAKLYEQGRLDLDAPVQQYVPSFPEKEHPVTTRQLGGHLAGVRHYRGDEFLIRDPYASVEEGLGIFKDAPFLHEPGTKYLYSTYGWNLISAVVEGASGRNFLEYMREEVFRPLAMIHTVADYVHRLIYQRAGFYARGEDGLLVNAPFVDNSHKWQGVVFSRRQKICSALPTLTSRVDSYPRKPVRCSLPNSTPGTARVLATASGGGSRPMSRVGVTGSTLVARWAARRCSSYNPPRRSLLPV